jgi:hypothetical protein
MTRLKERGAAKNENLAPTLPLSTREETAKILRIAVSTLDHLSAARKIGFTRLGRRCYYSPEDIEQFVESRRVEPAIEAKPPAEKRRRIAKDRG